MARLRTSLVTAMNQTKEQIKKGTSLEEAAHNAALTFNENEEEIIKKVKNYLEKESRKTGKVGRPRKEKTGTNKTNNKSKTQSKNRKTQNKTKIVADNVKEDTKINENIKKNSYTFNGEISIKLYGKESKINVVIVTKETDFNKAKEYVLNYLYNANVMTFISDKEFEKNLKNA